jgi:hypothetical protein
VLKGIPAPSARKSTPTVDEQVALSGSGLVPAISIIPNRGPPILDGSTEQASNGRREAIDRRSIEAVRGRPGVDAGGEQGLVRVDVAHARKHALIEKGDLDRPSSPGEAAVQVGGSNREGIGPEATPVRLERLRRVEHDQISETSRIDRPQQHGRTGGGPDAPSDVFVRPSSGGPSARDRMHEEASGHSQPHAEASWPLLDECEFLAEPVDPLDRRPRHRMPAFAFRRGRHEVASRHRDRLDHAAFEHRKRSANAFDFGKFRHGGSGGSSGGVFGATPILADAVLAGVRETGTTWRGPRRLR